MKNSNRTEYITRDAILKLLSDDEIASVSTAETAAELVDGDEYIDLREPDKGVRNAHESSTAPMGQVLPRKAVQEKTWGDIVALLSAHQTAGMHSSTK